MAYRLGDPTAKHEGRLTMNPLAHLDPLGTMMIIIVHFGWAKPVPVNPMNLKDPKKDMLWIALAGPVSNVIMAAGLGLILRIMIGMGMRVDGSFLGYFQYMLYFAVMINLVLAIFNMIPIPPLDGSKILFGLLPTEYEESYLRFQQIGPMVLLGLVVINSYFGIPIFSVLITPFVSVFSSLFVGRDLINLF
ncbi:MAG: site-2 protease family protein [Candidatus Marinimicrobia bacterium]|nr:site-2 protease family protein [Candidatus Neomarinimicrobiota bacterium]